MTKKRQEKKIILFSCSWHPYYCLDEAGRKGMTYPATVYPIRLSCLGRITPGIILKAFENGAAGVYLLGCPEGDCRHNSGNQQALEVYQEVKNLLTLLGYQEDQVRMELVSAENGQDLTKSLSEFIERIEECQKKHETVP